MLVVVFIQACTALQIVSEFVQYHKIQQMVLDQSSPESLQVFLFKAHLHNFGENLMLLKMSRCALSFVGCVGGGSVVPLWIIMTLLSSSHCKSILQSWCLPDVWLRHIGVKIFYSCCEKFNIFCSLLSSWYSPSQSCCSAIARMIFILSWYGEGISRIQPTLGFCEICCWKEFWSS